MLQGGVDLSYLRWNEYDGVGRERAQRPQLHRARLRPARRRRLLGPRAHRGLADAARTTSTGRSSSAAAAGRALAPHRRRLLRALGEHAGGRARRDGGGARSTARCVSYDLNYRDSLWRSVGGKAQAREVNRVADAVRRRAVRQRGGLLGRARLRARGRRREASRCCRPAAFRTMIGSVVRGVPQHQDGRDHAAHRALGERQRLGRDLLPRGAVLRGPADATSRSWTASAAAIRSPRASSTACSRGKDPQWALECGVAHGALAMSTPGDTTMATLAEVLRAMKGPGARIDR